MTKSATVPTLLLAGMTAAWIAAPAMADAAVASGRFEQLSLAVAPDGGVTGAYREEQGEGVTKTCTFGLSGRIARGGVAAVTIRSAGSRAVLPGRIVLRADGVVLTVPGARMLPGCGLVLMPEIDSGLALSRTMTTRWTTVRRIGVAKAALFAGPAGAAQRGYLVAGDIVGVGAGGAKRHAVDYVSAQGRVVRGWVGTGDMIPITPTR